MTVLTAFSAVVLYIILYLLFSKKITEESLPIKEIDNVELIAAIKSLVITIIVTIYFIL